MNYTTRPNLADEPLALARLHPEWSAAQPVTRGQWLALTTIIIAVIAGLITAPLATGRVLIVVCTIFYLIVTCYKLWLIRSSAQPDAWHDFSPAEIAAQEPRQWPVYSVIVPMYKEPETLPQMVKALKAFDYPEESKDVQLLLEADDDLTVSAAQAMDLPPWIRITLIPPSHPRTKPKACNIGLELARGKYLVIYDAEDKPEPDQLKKAVLAFERSPDNVACVQSCLNYYNPRQNILTRWFAAEYSAWYDMQLPGLSAAHAVIPLGGTSNHFKIDILHDLLGWDPYNVTEDCDLGVRICRAGYTTCMLRTTTWEEACSSLPFWIRQRTRWQKGYIQTWVVHMRNPLRLAREIGWRNFAHFQLLVGGSIFSTLINPIFWLLALAWFIVQPPGVAALYPGPIFAAGALCLFVGNFAFVYINLLGCYKRRYDSLLLWNLLTPIYWAMMSYSGWRAFIQFFKDPFLWEKTQHGLGGGK
ncbi:MAG: glycosyltransferase [Lentisphaerae bacterium]|nr:glycosyltransferase [Lentisphaerota bacterium]